MYSSHAARQLCQDITWEGQSQDNHWKLCSMQRGKRLPICLRGVALKESPLKESPTQMRSSDCKRCRTLSLIDHCTFKKPHFVTLASSHRQCQPSFGGFWHVDRQSSALVLKKTWSPPAGIDHQHRGQCRRGVHCCWWHHLLDALYVDYKISWSIIRL